MKYPFSIRETIFLRQGLLHPIQSKFRVSFQKLLDNRFILFTKNRAGAVDQDSSSLSDSGRILKNGRLKFAQAMDILLSPLPLEVRILPERSKTGAGNIRQHPIEFRPSWERERLEPHPLFSVLRSLPPTSDSYHRFDSISRWQDHSQRSLPRSSSVWAIWVVFPPGAAQASRIFSPGLGSRIGGHQLRSLVLNHIKTFFQKGKLGSRRRSLPDGSRPPRRESASGVNPALSVLEGDSSRLVFRVLVRRVRGGDLVIGRADLAGFLPPPSHSSISLPAIRDESERPKYEAQDPD